MTDRDNSGDDALKKRIAALEAELAAAKAREAKLRFLLDMMPYYVAFVGSDRRFEFNNAGYANWLPNADLEQMVGQELPNVIGDQAMEVIEDHLQHVESGNEFLFFGPVNTGNQGLRHVRIEYRPMIESGEYAGFGAIVEDFTTRRQEEERTRQAAVAFETARDAIVILNARHEVVQVNRAFEELTGYASEDAIGKRPWNLTAPGRQRLDVIWDTMQRKGHWQGELWHRHKDGSIGGLWVNVNTVADDRGTIHNYVAVLSDLESESHLAHMAHHDALTGLPNRLLLEARLQHTLERAERTKSKAAVLFMDLDGFKAVNDAFDHDEGDMVLAEIARRFRSTVRAIDTVARLGGDEFVIILDQVGDNFGAQDVAERVLQVMEPEVVIGKNAHSVGVSIGISVYPDDAEDRAMLVKRADVAMYAAKKAGKGQWATYVQDLGDEKSSAMG